MTFDELQPEDVKNIPDAELLRFIKVLSSYLIFDAVDKKDSRRLILGQTLAVAGIVTDLGGSWPVKLLEAINPVSQEISAEVEKGNPKLEDLMVARGDQMNEETLKKMTRKHMRQKEEQEIVKNVDIGELLEGTGAETTS